MGGPVETRVYNTTPATIGLLAKAALPSIPGLSLLPGLRRTGDKLPLLTLTRQQVGIDPNHLREYAEVCRFKLGDFLPLTYPHVLAFGLHLTLITDSRFPFPALGTIHVENVIVQHQPLAIDENVDIKVYADNLRAHPRGHTYDVITEIMVGEDLRWQERSTFLVRGKHQSSAEPSTEPLEPIIGPGPTWSLPADLGRRYSSVSGDHNPIHLYPITAKLFGFPRNIAHGMWSLARCLAALSDRLPDDVTVQVVFKRPILLPGNVRFTSQVDSADTQSTTRFTLLEAHSGKPHLIGRASRLR